MPIGLFELNGAVDLCHAIVELLLQGGDTGVQTLFGARDSFVDIGVAFRE